MDPMFQGQLKEWGMMGIMVFFIFSGLAAPQACDPTGGFLILLQFSKDQWHQRS